MTLVFIPKEKTKIKTHDKIQIVDSSLYHEPDAWQDIYYEILYDEQYETYR